MSHSLIDLYNEMNALIQAGDEAKVRAFIKEHLQEFPPEAQEKLTFAFFEEAVREEAIRNDAIRPAQTEALKTLEGLIAARQTLQDGVQLAGVKADLGL